MNNDISQAVSLTGKSPACGQKFFSKFLHFPFIGFGHSLWPFQNPDPATSAIGMAATAPMDWCIVDQEIVQQAKRRLAGDFQIMVQYGYSGHCHSREEETRGFEKDLQRVGK